MRQVDNRARDFILLVAIGLLLLAPTIISSVQAKSQIVLTSSSLVSSAGIWKNNGPEIVGAIAMMVAGIAVIFRKKD